MDSLFSRTKKLTKTNRPSNTPSLANSELSERAIPYDRIASGRSPVQVGTVSQGLRVVGTGIISAPITNPTLTLDGTDLNIHSGTRLRQEREALYAESATSGDDLSRNSKEGRDPMSPSSKKSRQRSGDGSVTSYFSGARRRGESDASGPSSSRPNMLDFGAYPASASTASTGRTSNLPGTNRSLATYPSEGTIGDESAQSRYPASVLSNGSDAVSSVTHQLREHLPHQVRESIQHLRQSYYGTTTSPVAGEFQLERPINPEEIDAMFERVRSERDIVEAVNMTMDQKWGIVYAHEQDRWNQLKKKEAVLKKAGATGGDGKPGNVVFAKDTPEWYLKKFMDQTITAKHVGSLTVSLRTLPIEYVYLLNFV